MPRTHPAHRERGGQIGGDDGVDEPVGKAWVENDCPPARAGEELAVRAHLEAGRGLHPAIDRENPEGRDERAERDHTSRREVQLAPHLVDAEQHDAEKTGLEKERRQHFIGQQRPSDVAGNAGEPTPVGAELVSHHHTRDHSHAKADREDLRPEQAKIFVVRLAGFQPAPFKDGDEAGEADAERRKNNVERNGERKLNAGEIECRDCGVHEREVA